MGVAGKTEMSVQLDPFPCATALSANDPAGYDVTVLVLVLILMDAFSRPFASKSS